MLQFTRWCRKPIASRGDVQKLLYGKRKNAVHSTSRAKPTAALVLTSVPTEQLAASVRHALAMEELTRADILDVLKSNRALRRLDRSLVLVDALRASDYPLTPHHYSLLMAHANDRGDTEAALRFWEMAVREGRVNEKVHGALLAAYRGAGRWQDATRHCAAMWEDKLVVDPHALHTVMNACRRNGPWASGLEVFARAVERGTRPNSVVYLELLRIVEHARPMPSRWRYALAILDALHGKIDVTAGHYNAVLTTLGGPRLWREGVALFESMKTRSVQPSRETLTALLLLNPNNVTHCIRCVAEAHTLGMPVTDTMYRAVLSNLFRMGLDHEASQFADREYRRDIEDAGHPSTTTLALSVALIDSLLAHPRPRDAVLFYEALEPKLGSAVGPATRALGTPGQPAQRWLVQGRVAVVDHNVILSPTLESLLHHYDSLFVPFSSVRLLVRRARQMGASAQGRYTRHAFVRLERLLRSGGVWSQVAKVLPLSHQLQAHQYLVGGPTTAENLRLLRSEADSASRTGPASLRQRLLASVTAESGPSGSVEVDTSGAGPLTIRWGAGAAGTAERRVAPLPRASEPAPPRPVRPYRLQEEHRVSSAERVLAVAVMLKSLNPEADVHVLSTNDTQLQAVQEWNRCRPHTPVTPVRYPAELFDKAPPATGDSGEAQSVDGESGGEGGATSREHSR